MGVVWVEVTGLLEHADARVNRAQRPDRHKKKPSNFFRKFEGFLHLVANQGFEPRTCGL
jgi:hypothetical protein